MADTSSTEPAPVAAPISVKAKASPVVMSESTKMILVVFFAILCDHFIRSESVRGVVLSASGVFATFMWGLWHRLRTWGALRFLASQVPDDVAKVGK